MSKQSDAKERQQYTPKFIPNVCGNCAHFAFDIQLPDWMRRQNESGEREGKGKSRWDIAEYGQERNKRCTLGGFAVKKTGSCAEWAGVDRATGA